MCCMEAIIVLFVLVVGPLALLAGRDSRVDDPDRRRHYLG